MCGKLDNVQLGDSPNSWLVTMHDAPLATWTVKCSFRALCCCANGCRSTAHSWSPTPLQARSLMLFSGMLTMYLPRQSTSALFASLSLVATGASKPWPTLIFFFDEHSKIPMEMLMTGLTCFETIFTTKTCGEFYIVLLTGSRSTLCPTIMVWSWPEGSIPAVAWDR